LLQEIKGLCTKKRGRTLSFSFLFSFEERPARKIEKMNSDGNGRFSFWDGDARVRWFSVCEAASS